MGARENKMAGMSENYGNPEGITKLNFGNFLIKLLVV
jgi:hypothetical protein